jgi:VWFA-related protein
VKSQIIAFAVVALVSGPDLAQQTFRARADAVAIDIAVQNRRVPIGGLTSADFAVTDNGVPQHVDSVSLETLPLDVSLVLDVSGSVTNIASHLNAEADRLKALLNPDDRIRLITFATDVSEVAPMQSGADLHLENISGKSSRSLTALNDALLYALMRPAELGRRQIVVTLTDGGDNASWVDPERLSIVARHADAVLYLLLTRGFEAPSQAYLLRTAQSTGGEAWDQPASIATIPDALGRALRDFRTNYLLLYSPTGVNAGGWHDLRVTIRGHSEYTVRARAGYFR